MNLAKYSAKTQAVLVESQKAARARQHQAIEPEHLLAVLLVDAQAKATLEKLGVATKPIEQKLEVELLKLPKVAGASNYLSPRFLKVTAAAEVIATKSGAKLVEAGHLLLALVDPNVGAGAPGRLLKDAGATREKLEPGLKHGAGATTTTSAAGDDGSALAKYAVDLTAKAKAGELDRVIGRDDETRRIIQVLARRRKNNPVLGRRVSARTRSSKGSRSASRKATSRRRCAIGASSVSRWARSSRAQRCAASSRSV
jgi:ATP-dependent Clp protease ATP-binding subunit ClpB